MADCLTVECRRPVRTRGLCNACYERLRRNGALDAIALPPTPRSLRNPGGYRGGNGGAQAIAERFWPKVNAGSPEECWLWNAARDSHGYGQLRITGGHLQAHRVSYELAIGQIPPGLHVRHRCDNPPCVNPLHLEVGTQSDNMRDCVERGRHGSQRRRQRERV